MFKNSRILPSLALASSLVIVLLVSRTPQALYSDPSWQLKAMQQYFAGESGSIGTLVQADPKDLSRNSEEWISWWPIGTNLLVYPFVRSGMSLAAAVRAVADLALIFGSIGFGYWLTLFEIPRWSAWILALAIPWIRYANLGLFTYSAEILVFAICPWLLLGTFHLCRRWQSEDARAQVAFSASLGCLLGLAYWLKYSSVFVSLGALVYIAFRSWKLRAQRKVWVDAVVVAGLFVLTAGAQNLLNRSMGAAMNSVTQSFEPQLDWRLPFNIVGLLGLGMADADGLWRYVLFHPGKSVLPFSPGTLALIGLPGGFLLFWVLTRPSKREPLILCRFVLLVSTIAFIGTMSVFGGRALEARLIAAIAIATLPAAAEAALAVWARGNRIAHGILLLGGLLYIAAPMAYGATAVIGKVRRTPHYNPGPSGFYNPLFADTDASSPLKTLEAHFGSQDIWYVPDPDTAIDLRGRVIVRQPDFLPEDRIRKESFHTSSPVTVRMLLPPKFEENGKGKIIRDSFPQAQDWRRNEIPGANYVEWTADLK